MPTTSKTRSFEPPGVVEKLLHVRPLLLTTWAVVLRPRAFLRMYHQAFERDRAGTSRSAAAAPALSPSEFLGLGIFWAALYAGLSEALFRPGGDAAVAAILGPDLVRLDLKRLTGIGTIDEALGDLARYVSFALFAGLFWVFSLGRLPLRWMAGAFAYIVGAFTILTMFARMISDLSMALDPGGGNLILALSWATFTANVVYIVASPMVFWPEILRIGRRRMVMVSIAAILGWIVLHAAVRIALLQHGYFLTGFGLGP